MAKYKVGDEEDNINNPKHYTEGGIETIKHQFHKDPQKNLQLQEEKVE